MCDKLGPSLGQNTCREAGCDWQRACRAQGLAIPEPESLDSKLANHVLQVVLHCLQLKVTGSPDNASTMSTLSADECREGWKSYDQSAASFFGIPLETATAIVESKNFHGSSLELAVGQIVFFLSASNWEIILDRVRQGLKATQSSEETFDLDFMCLSWSYVDKDRIFMVLKGSCYVQHAFYIGDHRDSKRHQIHEEECDANSSYGSAPNGAELGRAFSE